MARVVFTKHLARYFPDLKDTSFAGTSVRELLTHIEAKHPGLAGYIVDDQGALRKHVNIFIDGEPVGDRRELEAPLGADTEVHILQALSGGSLD
ncbi:MAG: MoaD/ThiS family protein [Myxococcales bacterium]|nr:MoaD/ThiS family protein [Myxococcales bacterium]